MAGCINTPQACWCRVEEDINKVDIETGAGKNLATCYISKQTNKRGRGDQHAGTPVAPKRFVYLFIYCWQLISVVSGRMAMVFYSLDRR